MLVLSRRVYESVRVGDDIEVSVVEVSPGKVRLAFKAPPHVRIVRSELLDTPPKNPPTAADIIRPFLPGGGS